MAEEENKLAAVPENKIVRGGSITLVKNVDLASCLVAIGIPLREDPPYTYKELANGEQVWSFHFEEQDVDGQIKTSDMIKAFRNKEKFIEENPRHVMTFAMCALINRKDILDHMKKHKDKPLLGFKKGKSTLWATKGSLKHAKYVKLGLKQI